MNKKASFYFYLALSIISLFVLAFSIALGKNTTESLIVLYGNIILLYLSSNN